MSISEHAVSPSSTNYWIDSSPCALWSSPVLFSRRSAESSRQAEAQTSHFVRVPKINT